MPASFSDLPRICFLGYPQLHVLAAPVVEQYSDRAHIEVVSGVFDDALAKARARIAAGSVDVFLSAGSNAAILKQGLPAHVVAIEADGFDILQALITARQATSRVGVITYGHTLPGLEMAKQFIRAEIAQYAYTSPEEARTCFERLHAQGFEAVVGSSFIVRLAQDAGMRGYLAYSTDGVRRGFEAALQVARVARLEASRYDQLNDVLDNLRDAVLAVDAGHSIVAANTPMLQLLGKTRTDLAGRPLDDIAPELSLRAIIASNAPEHGVLHGFASCDWHAQRTPLHEHGQVVGASIALYHAGTTH